MSKLVKLECPECESDLLVVSYGVIVCKDCDYHGVSINPVKLCYEMDDEE